MKIFLILILIILTSCQSKQDIILNELNNSIITNSPDGLSTLEDNIYEW